MGNGVWGEWQRYGMECPLEEFIGTPAGDCNSERSTLCSIRKGSSLCPNPFIGFTLWSESFEWLKGVGDQTTVS